MASIGKSVTVGHSVTGSTLMTCDFETLLALEDQMPRERFEQIKAERPDFAEWLNGIRRQA